MAVQMSSYGVPEQELLIMHGTLGNIKAPKTGSRQSHGMIGVTSLETLPVPVIN